MAIEVDALDNVFHLLASFPTPQEVIDFKANEKESNRFDYLIERNRIDELSQLEIEELNVFILAERYMRLAKAKALLAIRGIKVA